MPWNCMEECQVVWDQIVSGTMPGRWHGCVTVLTIVSKYPAIFLGIASCTGVHHSWSVQVLMPQWVEKTIRVY